MQSYNESRMNDINVISMKDRELNEWKSDKLLKLRVELQVVGCECQDILRKDDSANQEDCNSLASLWHSSWKGCEDIIARATLDTKEQCSWLLDKRFHLRKELEEYGKTGLTELAEALSGDKEVLALVDQCWRESWKSSMELMSEK